MKLANDYKSAEEEFKSAIKIGGINSSCPRLIMSLSILQKMNVEKITITEFAKCLYYLVTGGLTFAWDVSFLKMLYKNFSEDFSVLCYKASGELFERLNNYEAAAKVYNRAAINTQRGEIFYNKMGDICVRRNNMDSAVECYKKVLEIGRAHV